MTKEEAIKKAKKSPIFLRENPEWNDDKDIAIITLEDNGWNLAYLSDRLRKDKEIIMHSIKYNFLAIQYSLLDGYKTFEEIMEKEGETFLFSCWRNRDYSVRIEVANHPNFLPTEEQIAIGLEDEDEDVRQVYKLRKDEWFAKIEENTIYNMKDLM